MTSTKASVAWFRLRVIGEDVHPSIAGRCTWYARGVSVWGSWARSIVTRPRQSFGHEAHGWQPHPLPTVLIQRGLVPKAPKDAKDDFAGQHHPGDEEHHVNEVAELDAVAEDEVH